jgi:aminopeptidase N
MDFVGNLNKTSTPEDLKKALNKVTALKAKFTAELEATKKDKEALVVTTPADELLLSGLEQEISVYLFTLESFDRMIKRINELLNA